MTIMSSIGSFSLVPRQNGTSMTNMTYFYRMLVNTNTLIHLIIIAIYFVSDKIYHSFICDHKPNLEATLRKHISFN